MLSLHGLGAAGEGAAGYYTALARDDYYTQGGEPAGHWFGQGAAALGLSGTVDETALRHVLHGFDGAGDGGRLQSPQRLGGPAGVAPPVLAQIHHLGIAPELAPAWLLRALGLDERTVADYVAERARAAAEGLPPPPLLQANGNAFFSGGRGNVYHMTVAAETAEGTAALVKMATEIRGGANGQNFRVLAWREGR